MKRRTWTRTAGAVAFAAQLVAAGGLAGASDNACFPQPKFVYGGDPQFDSLTADNLTRWTGSYGFGWANGGGAEVSYEGALANNPAYPISGHSEIGPQQLLLAFAREVKIGSVDGAEGARVGINYTYTDHGGTAHTASQILVIEFDAGGHTSTWNTTPPACSAGSLPGTECFNNAGGDPAQFVSFKPGFVQVLKQTDTGTTDVWPSSGDITQWVKDNTRVWLFGDTTVTPTQYSWRMHVALPIRRASTGATAPDPGVTDSWTSPSVYLDEDMFTSDLSKKARGFWIDFITKTNDLAMVTYHPYPDSDALKAARTSNTYQVPSSTIWGTSELGSPRDASLLSPGELQCSGSGITIEASTADKVVWHSDIWNTSAGTNSAGLFNDGGRLYMVDATGALKANVLAVKVKNTSTTNKPDRSALNAHFLVAPYGSQAIGTVWAPLSTGGNDYKCSGSTTTGNTSCQPLPIGSTSAIDSQSTTTGTMNAGDTAELDLKSGGWKPSADYMCAVQTTDTPMYSWYYQDAKEATICAGAVYKPSSMDGSVPLAAGLPGHQCLQVQLSSTAADVQFATKSAFRNMHQAVASMHRETATVDTRGLPKVKNKSYHDIYLYVETRNMPYRVDAGYSPVPYGTAMQLYNRRNRCDGEYCPPGVDETVPAPSDEFFTKVMPTYVVHTYADVGVTYNLNGRAVPVLKEMTSFGQFISHDATTEGPVFGWDAGLEPAAGTQFQKVGPNTYRIRIPNDGAGQVVTHVEPLPSKRPTCSGTVNMDIVQLLQSIAPLIKVSPEDAGEIDTLIDSLQIQCVDLAWFLDKIGAKDWGPWTSWVKFLITQIETASGCKCQ